MVKNKTFARYEAVQQHFFDLKEKKTIVHFGNTFAQYDLLAWLVENITGKATIIISSYTASEELGRIIAQLNEHKLIENISVILDRSASQIPAFHFISTQANRVRLLPNHSKSMLILGDKCGVAVLSSANMNGAIRMEQTIVSLDDDIVKQTWEGLTKMVG